MNIFYLDEDPRIAAQYHCDSHVVKMTLETAQILSTVVRTLVPSGQFDSEFIYKASHKNHPCTKWAMESFSNWRWLYDLGIALGAEYTHRYGKVHRSVQVITACKPSNFNLTWRLNPTPPALAMPDFCKIPKDPVASYRKYYAEGKQHLLRYTNREVPQWLQVAANEASRVESEVQRHD